MIGILGLLINLYGIGLIVYAVTTWIDHPNAARVRRTLEPFYEPLLAPIRRALGTLDIGRVGFDFSPIVLWVLVTLAGNMVLALIA